MAKILFGQLVSGVRGTVGGVTYSAGRSGPYIKPWAKPTNPKTSLQQAHRADWASSGALWRDLTAQQRSDWEDFAIDPAQELTDALGNTYYASGWNWFQTVRSYQQISGESPPTDIPASARPSMPDISGASCGASPAADLVITFPAAEFEDMYAVAEIAVSPGSTQALPGQSRLRLVCSDLLGALDDEWTFPDIDTTLGTISSGAIITVAIHRQTQDGQRSTPQWIACEVP